MAPLALEAGHLLERGVAGEFGLALDAAGAARGRGEAVRGHFHLRVLVRGDRAQAFAQIDCVKLDAATGAVQVAEELALQRLDRALALEAGETVVGSECRHRRPRYHRRRE